MTTLLVAAAVIIEEGRVLLTRRKRGSHLEGVWELPGGKVEPDEDPRQAVERELQEELGIVASARSIACVTFHRYEEVSRSMLLLFYWANRAAESPEPRALDVADFRWASADELDALPFPEADREIVAIVARALSDAR